MPKNIGMDGNQRCRYGRNLRAKGEGGEFLVLMPAIAEDDVSGDVNSDTSHSNHDHDGDEDCDGSKRSSSSSVNKV